MSIRSSSPPPFVASFDTISSASFLQSNTVKTLSPDSTGKSSHLPDAANFDSTSSSQDAFYNSVIYNSARTSPPTPSLSPEQRTQRIDAYAGRVETLIKNIEQGSEGERNIKFQQARQFLEPAGYFSGGVLAAGYNPHEKFTVKFYSSTGFLRHDGADAPELRTYFAWEIAAGALEHDKVPRGGPITVHSMHIEPADRSRISDLESIGRNLQNHWEHKVASPMRDTSGALAHRSGKADTYVLRGTLQSLLDDNGISENLSHEGLHAIKRTLQKNGQVIIPNIYGYPLAGYAFIPYTEFDGDSDHRPNKGVIIDLKNGKACEIHSDKDFAAWAKSNRNNLLQGFNASDRQGRIDAHWPKAGDVLDTLIKGNHASYPGYQNFVKDQAVPVWETFNYTQSRGTEYRLKYGNLNSSIAAKYQELNAKNAVWSDQTEVFGSSQQNWKAAKEFWGNTFGYVPVVGNTGNIVFGVHDALYGMTAEDRVGGNAAAIISALQLAHELLPVAAETEPGEAILTFDDSNTEHYNWRHNATTKEVELVRAPKYEILPDEDYLSAESVTNLIPEIGVSPSSSNMREIAFNGKKYFAADTPDAGDGEHYLLHVPDRHNPEKFVSSGVIAAPDKAGVWRRRGVVGGGGIKQYFSKKYAAAREHLNFVAEKHKNASIPATEEEKHQFINTMVKLMGESNAEDFDLIENYSHAGSDFVNVPLRAGVRTPELEQFLVEFNQLNPYEGKAYRSAFITAEGAKRIKDSVGKIFHDPGVQSASATIRNSVEWEGWAKGMVKGKGHATQQVVYVFDESVPKMNLSTSLLKDHVAIGPGEFMKVMAVKEQEGKLFVYISSPTKTPNQVFNIFDGEVAY